MTQQEGNNRKRAFKSLSGQEMPAIVRPETVQPGNCTNQLPGEPPFQRGIHARMYRERLWTMRQYSGFGSAAETNERFHLILKQGGSGLSVAFDLPTQLGYDCDHTLAVGEVGRVGVSISTVDDMALLLKGLQLDQISLSMTINATAPILLAFLLVLAEEQKIPWTALRGTVQNDILKEHLARGNYIYPPEAGVFIAADLVKFCSEHVQNWNSMSISGYHIREAGSTAVQELAFTFAHAIAYVDAVAALGLAPEKFVGQLAFFFNSQIDFLEEVSKFRIARKLWDNILLERFAIQDADLRRLRFHTQTAGSSLTAQQPLNNFVRTTIEALAAVLGGTQSLHTNAHDEALGLPTESSASAALRIQQIIAEETGVTNVVDPLAGSYLIEARCEQMEKEVLSMLAAIDSMGGVLHALKSGWSAGEIEKSAYAYQTEVEAGERLVVGVNSYQDETDVEPQAQQINQAIEEEQKNNLKNFKSARDLQKVGESLQVLADAAKARNSLMPLIVQAVRNRATLGEVSDCLRQVFGEQDR
jgi:methylmalonyl-CoA mutase N-terminal domain/subunit